MWSGPARQAPIVAGIKGNWRCPRFHDSLPVGGTEDFTELAEVSLAAANPSDACSRQQDNLGQHQSGYGT
jgi:hypothetical protein